MIHIQECSKILRLTQVILFVAMDLSKVQKIPHRIKDVVIGFVKSVQCLLPKDVPYYNIVDLIIHTIILYYHMVIESNLLSRVGKFSLRFLYACLKVIRLCNNGQTCRYNIICIYALPINVQPLINLT